MGAASGMYGGEENKYIQGFAGEVCRKEALG